MSEQVRIGVIGAGRIGKLHARNLSFMIPDAEILAVSDVYLEAAQQCGGMPYSNSHDQSPGHYGQS